MAKKKTKTSSQPKRPPSSDFKRHYDAVKDTYYHYMPFTANTITNFNRTMHDINDWVKTSTPFRKNPAGTSDEKKIYKIANNLFEATKADFKEGNLLTFRNLNAKIGEMIGGMGNQEFDDMYDAEYDTDDSDYSSSSYDGFDGEMFMEGTAVTAQATIDAVSGATDVLADVQLKASDYSAKRIVAGTNIAISHVLKYQAANADILNAVNQNISTLVETVSRQDEFQSQATRFYDTAEERLNDIIELLRTAADPVAARREENEKYAKEKESKIFTNGGLDPGKLMKSIWNESSIGMLGKMGLATIQPIASLFGFDFSKLIGDMAGGMGGSFEGIKPLQMLFDMTPIARQIRDFTQSQEAMWKVGFHRMAKNARTFKKDDNMGLNEIFELLSFLGINESLTKYGSIDLSEYDKGVAPTTGITLKAIETVIPKYLSNIENDIAALLEGFTTGQFEIGTFEGERYKSYTQEQKASNAAYFDEMRSRDHANVYDFNEGKFKTNKILKTEFQDEVNGNFESAFYPIFRDLSSIIKLDANSREEFNKDAYTILRKLGNTRGVIDEDRDKFTDLVLAAVDRAKFGYDRNLAKAAVHKLWENAVIAAANYQNRNTDFFKRINAGETSYEQILNNADKDWLDEDEDDDAKRFAHRTSNKYNTQHYSEADRAKYAGKDVGSANLKWFDIQGDTERYDDNHKGDKGYDFGEAITEKFNRFVDNLAKSKADHPEGGITQEQLDDATKLRDLFKEYSDSGDESKKKEYVKFRKKYEKRYGNVPNDMMQSEFLDLFSKTAKMTIPFIGGILPGVYNANFMQKTADAQRNLISYGQFFPNYDEEQAAAEDWRRDAREAREAQSQGTAGTTTATEESTSATPNDEESNVSAEEQASQAAQEAIVQGRTADAAIQIAGLINRVRNELPDLISNQVSEIANGIATQINETAGDAVEKAKTIGGAARAITREAGAIAQSQLGISLPSITNQANTESEEQAAQEADTTSATPNEPEPERGLKDKEFSTEGATVLGNEESEESPMGEMRTNTTMNIKEYAFDRVKKAKTWAEQQKALFMELATNIRILTGNSEDQRFHLFGPDGVFRESFTKLLEGFHTVERFFFGDKNDEGYYKGGLFSPTVANKVIDARKEIANRVKGTAYTDYDGNYHEEREDYLLKGVGERLDAAHEDVLTAALGDNFRESEVYNHKLFGKFRLKEDRYIDVTRLGDTHRLGEDGIAIDTYDWKWVNNKLVNGVVIQGWKWDDAEGEWILHYDHFDEKDLTERPSRPQTDKEYLPKTGITNQVVNVLREAYPPTDKYLTERNKRRIKNKVDQATADAMIGEAVEQGFIDSETGDSYKNRTSNLTPENSASPITPETTWFTDESNEGFAESDIDHIPENIQNYLDMIYDNESNIGPDNHYSTPDAYNELFSEDEEELQEAREERIEAETEEQRMLADTYRSISSKIKKAGRTGLTIFTATLGMALGGPAGAVVGGLLGSGRLTAPLSKAHKMFFGDYAQDDSDTPVGHLKHDVTTALKKTANLALTVLGTTFGAMIGGPAGAAVGFALGSSSFKQGGLKTLIFGGKHENGEKTYGLIGNTVRGIGGLLFGRKGEDGKRGGGLLGLISGGAKGVKEIFDGKTKDSGIAAPIIGSMIGMSMLGPLGLLLGGMGGKVVGQIDHNLFGNEGNGEGEEPETKFIPEPIQDEYVGRGPEDEVVDAQEETTFAVETQTETLQEELSAGFADISERLDEYDFDHMSAMTDKQVEILQSMQDQDKSEYDLAKERFAARKEAAKKRDAEQKKIEKKRAEAEKKKQVLEKERRETEWAQRLHNINSPVMSSKSDAEYEHEIEDPNAVGIKTKAKNLLGKVGGAASTVLGGITSLASVGLGAVASMFFGPEAGLMVGKVIGGLGRGLAIGLPIVGGLVLLTKLFKTDFGMFVKEKVGGLLSNVGDWVGTTLGKIGRGLLDTIKNIDWKEVIDTGVDIVKDIGKGIKDGAKAFWKEMTHDRDNEGKLQRNNIEAAAGVDYDYVWNEETQSWDEIKKTGLEYSTAEREVQNAAASGVKTLIGANAAAPKILGGKNMVLEATKGVGKGAKGLLEIGGATIKSSAENAWRKTAIKAADKVNNGALKVAEAEGSKHIKDIVKKLQGAVEGFIGRCQLEFMDKATSKSSALAEKAGQWISNLKTKIASLANNSKLLQLVKDRLGPITEQIGKIASSKTIGAIAYAGFVIDGVVSGGAWDARGLFGIEESQLDATMREISAEFSGLVAADPTGIVALFDLANSLIYTATDFNIKREIATIVYRAKMFFMGDYGKRAVDSLLTAQEDYAKRLEAYNKATGSNMSQADFEEKTEFGKMDFWRKGMNDIGDFFGVDLLTKKQRKKLDEKEAQVNEMRNIINQYQADEIVNGPADQYQNRSIEDMTDETEEGYGPNGGGVGYGLSNSDHYSQLDTQWRNVAFGKMRNGRGTTIGSGGCGPTALATVARSLTGNRSITPTTIANMAQDYGYTANGGSAASLFTEGANRLGLSSKRISVRDIPSNLAAGQKIIVSGRRKGSQSPYTNAGHIISLSGIKNGKAVVDDPLKSDTETKDVRSVLQGAKKAWVIGSGNVGYGNLDDYIDNMESMGYGFDENGELIDFNAQGGDKYQAWKDGKSYGDLVSAQGGVDNLGIFFPQGNWGAGYAATSANAWSSLPVYGSTFADAGCFPTAYASVFSNITRTDIDPPLILKKFGQHWSDTDGYLWTGYRDMLDTLYGTGAPALEDQLFNSGFTESHEKRTDDWLPSGYSNLSREEKVNTAMKYITNTLMKQGAVWIDAAGNQNNTNLFTTEHNGGHAVSLYGYEWSDGQEPGTLYDNYEGGATTTELDPGRSMSSGAAIRKISLSQLRQDINNGRIRRIATFPKPNTSIAQTVQATKDAFADFAKDYTVRTGQGGTITGTAANATTATSSNGTMTDVSGFSAPSGATGTTTGNDPGDYNGYQYADQLNLDDKTFLGKLGNLMSILGGIAGNMLNSLSGGKYESVFGHTTSYSGGSSSYTLANDLNTFGGSNHVPKYLMVTDGMTKKNAYVDVGDLDLSDDEILTSVAQDVTRHYAEIHHNTRDTPLYDEDPSYWEAYVNQMKRTLSASYANNEFVDGRYYKFDNPYTDADDAEGTLIPAWYNKDNVLNRLKEDAPFDTAVDRMKELYPQKTDEGETEEEWVKRLRGIYDKNMNSVYNKYALGVSDDSSQGSRGVQMYDYEGKIYTEDEIQRGITTKDKLLGNSEVVETPTANKAASDKEAAKAAKKKAESEGNGVGDTVSSKSQVHVADGSTNTEPKKPQVYTSSGNIYSESDFVNGLSKDELEKVDIITPQLISGLHVGAMPEYATQSAGYSRYTEQMPASSKLSPATVAEIRDYVIPWQQKHESGTDPSSVVYLSGESNYTVGTGWYNNNAAEVLGRIGNAPTLTESQRQHARNYAQIINRHGTLSTSELKSFLRSDGVADVNSNVQQAMHQQLNNYTLAAPLARFDEGRIRDPRGIMQIVEFSGIAPATVAKLTNFGDGSMTGVSTALKNMTAGFKNYGKYGKGWANRINETQSAFENATDLPPHLRNAVAAEGYGNPFSSTFSDTDSDSFDITNNKVMGRMLGEEFNNSEGFGIGAISGNNTSTLNITSNRGYSPTISTDDHSKSEIDVNVNLGKLENGTSKMITLLERIAVNTGAKATTTSSNNTTINHIHEAPRTTNIGYGEGNSKPNQNIAVNTNQQINHNHVDKMRKIHDLVAKSPRAYK